MATLYYMVGLPGSGKSTYAKTFAEKNDAVVLSSDKVRAEIYGDANVQADPGKVFSLIFEKAKVYLANGVSVVVDATNINSKKRIHALKQFSGYRKVCIYMATHVKTCIKNDKNRERTVGEEVINRMYLGMQVPVYGEGWDDIQIIKYTYPNEQLIPLTLDELTEWYRNIDAGMWHVIQPGNLEGFEQVFNRLMLFTEFNDIRNLPHDSKYHSLSVGRHTYHVFEYLHQNYPYTDRVLMLWAALFHDTGKIKTKRFKEGSRFANFIGHENVSAQIAMIRLSDMGYDDQFVVKAATIVQYHMKHFDLNSPDSQVKFKNFIGEELYDKLKLFNEADRQAH